MPPANVRLGISAKGSSAGYRGRHHGIGSHPSREHPLRILGSPFRDFAVFGTLCPSALHAVKAPRHDSHIELSASHRSVQPVARWVRSGCRCPACATQDDAAHRACRREADVRCLHLQVPRQHHQRAVPGVRESGAGDVLLVRLARSRPRLRDRAAVRPGLRVRVAHAEPLDGAAGAAPGQLLRRRRSLRSAAARSTASFRIASARMHAIMPSKWHAN